MSNEPEKPPILDCLRQILDEGKALASKADLKAIGIEFWVIKLRSVLAKVYGLKADQLNCFPPPGHDDLGLSPQVRITKRLAQTEKLVRELQALPYTTVSPSNGKSIFIGHGRSLLWLKLKEFMTERLVLPCEEFNSEPTPGIHTTDRLEAMLSRAGMAFLVMTAEEKHADGTLHARPNVIHEIGLFQARLGPHRAIVMIEDGCTEFSNLSGLTTIRFPSGDVAARFEDVRRVLEREEFA
ncbi:putative nucleotide-binding protein containing TIR-like domain protein [bacterium BMS3Bbin14]|nr:putative nucleotide-binding protein containing TIR-like domain protein [bacterium BMS3Bbin14]